MNKFRQLMLIVALSALICNTNVFSQNKSVTMKEDARKIQPDHYVYIRYIVNDVKESVDFYTQVLGFKAEIQPPSGGFAQLSLGNLKLLINRPNGGGGAGQMMDDGVVPSPGGWNRIQIRVADLEKMIAELKLKNVTFRNELVTGNGGKQILVQDPSGNLIELFESFK